MAHTHIKPLLARSMPQDFRYTFFVLLNSKRKNRRKIGKRNRFVEKDADGRGVTESELEQCNIQHFYIEK